MKKVKGKIRNFVPDHHPTRVWYYAIVSPEGEILEKYPTLVGLDGAQERLNKYYGRKNGFKIESFVKILKDR